MIKNLPVRKSKNNMKLIFFPKTKVISIAKCKVLISINKYDK